MKKLLALLLVFALLFTFTACGTEEEAPSEPSPVVTESPEPEPEEPEEEEETPVTGMDIHGAIHRIAYGDNVVYLFGSMHAERDTWFPLADVVEDAMQRADMFATEIDLADLDAQMEALGEVMLMPDGQTWSDYLPQEAYDHLVETLLAWGIAAEEMYTLNPHFLVFALSMEMAQSLADVDTGGLDISVDSYVQNVALERDIPVFGLESIEQQMQILYNPPLEAKIAHIMGFLPPDELMELFLSDDVPSLDDLADAYETNDLARLAALFALELSEDVVGDDAWGVYMRETVMNWRSTYYANVLADFLRETEEPTTLFAVVGISHIMRSMGGAEFTDIIEQLELLGFEPEAIWQ